MTDQLQEIIKEIAAKHGVAVGRNDPILMLYTINEELIKQNEGAQKKMLDIFKSEIEGVAQRWEEDAKNKAEKTLNAALSSGKAAMGKGLKDAVEAAEKSIKDVVDGAIDQFEKRLEKSIHQARSFAILNMAAAAMVIVAVASMLWAKL